MLAVSVAYPAVMTGGDIIRPQSLGILQKWPEFNLPVTQNVGIRRTSLGIFVQKISKYALLILGGKVNRVIRNIQQRRDSFDVLEVLLCGTTTVVV